MKTGFRYLLASAFVLVAAATMFAGCAKRSEGLAMDEAQVYGERSAGAVMGDAAPALAKAAAVSGEPSPAAPVDPQVASDGRKLVYVADMRVEVKDIAAAESLALAALASAGGYAQSRSATESSVYMVLRLPVDRLDGLMDSFEGQGKLLSRSVSADDVTDQYFNLEGRLRNKRILEERYRAYLRDAKTISDILEVEARLSDTTNEIEWMEGSFRDLGKRIELATLSLELVPVYAADPAKPSLGEALGRFFSGAGDVFRGALVFLVGLAVYGVPAVLFLALAWWLAFGKVGLLRRLFSLVRAERGKAKNT